MDITRFDQLTKRLSATGSRRGAVAASLGGLLAAVIGRDATAKRQRSRRRENAPSVQAEQVVQLGQLKEGIDYVGRTVVITSDVQGFQTANCSGNGTVWEIYNAVIVAPGGDTFRATSPDGILLPPQTPAKPGDRFLVTGQVPCPGSFDEITLEPL